MKKPGEPTIAEAVAAYGWPPKHAALPALPVMLPQSWAPVLAPDGGRVAFISDRGGAPRAFVMPLDGPAAQLETGGEPVTELSWSPDGQWIACVIAPGGSVRHEVWLIRPDGTDLKLAIGAADGSAFLGEWAADSGRLAVTHTGRAAQTRAYLVHPSASATLAAEGEMLQLIDVSLDEQALLLLRGKRNARWLSVARTGQAELPLLGGAAAVSEADGGGGSSDLGYFSADGRSVFVRSDLGRERASLREVSLADGSGTIIAERADAELESIAISRDRRVLALLWNSGGGRSELSQIDLVSRVEQPVRGPSGLVWSGLSLSHDGRVLALTSEGPNEPRSVWVLEAHGERMRCVTQTRSTLPPPFAAAELHRFVAADGVKLSGWLYRAPTTAPPGPVVIHLHGGPEAQERPVWNPLYNEIRARGISVFAPNVRGSSGFGRAFVHADNRERRTGAIEDVQACVDYLVREHVADRAKVGCMGRSYGGYLTLAALVQYPQSFAVGVDTCGMADLQTFYERTEPWIAAQAVSKYGHPQDDRALLHALSPLHKLDQLAAPLLVVHGAHDSNVPLYESEQLVRALATRKLSGGFLLFGDEGHEILQRANQARYIQVVSDWLATYLLA